MPDKAEERRLKLAKAQGEVLKEARIIYDMVATEQGKEGYKQLRQMFYDRTSFSKGDPYETAFFEGQRDVVAFIRRCLKHFEKGVDGDVDI